MSSGFDTALNIGGVSQESQGFSLRMFSKPSIVLAHLAFKGAALAYYFLANWLSSSFIIQFLIIDQSRFPVMDRRAFWFGLVLGPLLWIFFVSMAFFTFKWEWMIVALLGLAMTSANLYGYLRCRWADTTQFTNYLSKWAFLSVLRRQNPSTSDPMQQTI
ncbi:hypothetical protein ANCCEY_04093 [Ancylostoma ceylanicum]|uniref:Golgi apparatus membrane protein TVP23 homolog n=1 Tax=Ancylostoma ceylanicum TaxID=53326 RepID=A0A0D6M3C0_9BILA|nr:hypothetical protein ANCCEY_04093 [Ancylostoma ceylanicum]